MSISNIVIIFLLLSLGLSLFFNYSQYNQEQELNYELVRSHNNLQVAQDSLRYYKEKDNSVSSEKSLLTLNTIKELKKENSELYQKLKQNKRINRDKGITTVETVVKYVEKKVMVRDTVYRPEKDSINSWRLAWSKNKPDSSRLLAGYSDLVIEKDTSGCHIKKHETQITQDEIRLKLIATFFEDKKTGLPSISINTDNDNVSITHLEGATIPDKLLRRKKPLFNVGVQMGYGALFSWNGNLYHGPYLGVGLSWNILKLGR